jgi:hypothetical protein
MKFFVATLLICPWLALSAWSQTQRPFPVQPLLEVQQFLGLSDDQVKAILQNNGDYNTFASQQQQRISLAQGQILVETAKNSLDPMAIGALYAGIETACRDLFDRAATSQKRNLSILTDSQRTKLNVLDDAIKLAPIISQAQSGNLLGSAGSPPLSFITETLPVTSRLIPNLVSGVSGCGGNGVIPLVIYDPINPVPIGSSQIGVAGVNQPPSSHWFRKDPAPRQ